MKLFATVLIPTYDHGPLLKFALASALSQNIQDLEVLVVGDGAPHLTRTIVDEVRSQDDRVRYFEFPKGPRHGEIHRKEVLKEARGQNVFYLSDDDLWFPDHVETLGNLLRESDFASGCFVQIAPGNQLLLAPFDLAQPLHRKWIMEVDNRVPLSFGAHTMESYERLPHGWRTTPPGIYTDLYMWRQFLADPMCIAASAKWPTGLSFPAKLRRSWVAQQRFDELEYWWRYVCDPVRSNALRMEAKKQYKIALEAYVPSFNDVG